MIAFPQRLGRPSLRLAGAAAVLLVSASVLQAQAKQLVGSVRGVVGEPIAGAQVVVRGNKTPALTDAEGRFVIPGVSDGLIVVTTKSPGMVPIVDILQHVASDTLAITLSRPEADAVEAGLLDEVDRDVKRVGDRYERSAAASRSAKYFTDRDIERRGPSVTTDLFVGLVGFTVDGNGSDAGVWSMRDGCYPTVWVDELERPHFSLNDIRPSQIKLLLAWNGYAAIPARLRSTRVEPTCGAVLVLLKK